MDYLRARIEDPDTVDFFCREAKDSGWLTWLAEEPLFRRIFEADPQSSDGAVQRALSFWLADSFVVQSPAEAMQAIVQLGSPLPLTLWEAIARVLWMNRPPPVELRRWIALLLATAPHTTDGTLARVLEESRPSDDDEVAATLFDWLAQPVPTIEAAGVLASFGADPWRAEMAAGAEPERPTRRVPEGNCPTARSLREVAPAGRRAPPSPGPRLLPPLTWRSTRDRPR